MKTKRKILMISTIVFVMLAQIAVGTVYLNDDLFKSDTSILRFNFTKGFVVCENITYMVGIKW